MRFLFKRNKPGCNYVSYLGRNEWNYISFLNRTFGTVFYTLGFSNVLICSLALVPDLDDCVKVHDSMIIIYAIISMRLSRRPRVLRRGSATNRLLELRVRIPPEVWPSLCCECCGLSLRGLSDGLNSRPDKSYRGRCV